MAGELVTNIAESLGPLILAQLIDPGHPVVPGTFTFPTNMSTGAPFFCNITIALASAGFAQFWRRYRIPTQLTLKRADQDEKLTYKPVGAGQTDGGGFSGIRSGQDLLHTNRFIRKVHGRDRVHVGSGSSKGNVGLMDSCDPSKLFSVEDKQ